MAHREYEDLVATADEANERSHDNEIELKEVQEKLKALIARMDTQDNSMDLIRRQVDLLNEKVKRRLIEILDVLCCKQEEGCDRQATDQSVLADVG